MKAMSMPLPEDESPVQTRLKTSWSPTCSSSSDCETGQACYPYYYQWDDSYSRRDFDNGVTCMEEETEACEDPNSMFAITNADFATTGSDYKITFKCSPGATGVPSAPEIPSASGASVIAITILAAITALNLF